MGKEGYISLPVSSQHQQPTAGRLPPWGKKLLATIALSSLFILSTDLIPSIQDRLRTTDGAYVSTSCHQAEPLLPTSFDPRDAVHGQEGRIRDWLSGAVKVPTEMFDVMGEIGEDKRWDVFYNFSDCTYHLLPNLVSLPLHPWDRLSE